VVPVGVCGMGQAHTERDRGGIKCSAGLKHHLNSWVFCHVAVTSDIMCGIMCCTSRQDNLGGLEHTRKQSIRTELVPSMALVSAFIAFVRVPPQNPTVNISVNKEVTDTWCMTSDLDLYHLIAEM